MGTPTHPVRLGPPEGFWEVQGRGHPLGFQVGKQRPREAETHLPLPMEPGERGVGGGGGPCSGDPVCPVNQSLWETLGGCSLAKWGQRKDSGGAQASLHPEGGSCTGCLWLGPGSPTRGLPLPLRAGVAATARPTP